MTNLTIRNLVFFLALLAIDAVLACMAAAIASGSLWGFWEGQFFAPVALQLGAGLGVVTAGLSLWLQANRPRFGREDISALVTEIGQIKARAILTDVLHGGQAGGMSDADVQRVATATAKATADEIEARMKAEAAP